FAKNGKAKVTIEQLLLHTSGLTADNAEADYHDSKEKALAKVYELGLEAPPGTRFRYSDVGFIVLGELVNKVAEKSLDKFAHEHIFTPLGMKDTGFLPEAAHKERAAPCNLRDDQFIQGEVHDPRAYGLGGVAGHAGLFSTADDLALYVRMIL